MVGYGPDRRSLGRDRRALLGRGAARVDEDGLDREAPLSEPGNAVGGVQSAREGEGNDFLHSA